VAKVRDYVFTSQTEGTTGSLNLLKISLIFDPKASPECVENFVIKQQMFEKKAIKRAILFHSKAGPRYLVLSVFSNIYKISKNTQGADTD
jgi:hypothetical protein